MIVVKSIANKGLKCLKGDNVKFKKIEKRIKSSFMIYADFESILVPVQSRK